MSAEMHTEQIGIIGPVGPILFDQKPNRELTPHKSETPSLRSILSPIADKSPVALAALIAACSSNAGAEPNAQTFTPEPSIAPTALVTEEPSQPSAVVISPTPGEPFLVTFPPEVTPAPTTEATPAPTASPEQTPAEPASILGKDPVKISFDKLKGDIDGFYKSHPEALAFKDANGYSMSKKDREDNLKAIEKGYPNETPDLIPSDRVIASASLIYELDQFGLINNVPELVDLAAKTRSYALTNIKGHDSFDSLDVSPKKPKNAEERFDLWLQAQGVK